MAGSQGQIKAFCAQYGITYDTPTYELTRSDLILYEMGIYRQQNVKNNLSIHQEIQAVCPFGVFQHYLYAEYYCFPLFGQKRLEKLSHMYIAVKLALGQQLLAIRGITA